MVQALVLAISHFGHSKQFEAKPQIPGIQPIICTEPMELVHIDYVRMEVTVATQEKPVMKNVLQGLSVLIACIGSSDPVRVLHLYTTNTLDTL